MVITTINSKLSMKKKSTNLENIKQMIQHLLALDFQWHPITILQ